MNHATLGASTAHRWLNCPGSIRQCEGIRRDSSPYAEEGTAAHYLAEVCLKKNQMAAEKIGVPLNLRGAAGSETLARVIVTQEMADAVQVYLDTVRGDLATIDEGVLAVEQKFDLSASVLPGMFGTNDACIVQPFGKLVVYDYKHGQGVAVEAANNPQMLYYALGAVQSVDVADIELVIVQPRAPHPDGPVRRWTLSLEDLLKWRAEVLRPGALAAREPDAPLAVGDWCKFCPAMAVCPEQARSAQALAVEVFRAAELPGIPAPTPGALSPEDLARVLAAESGITAWLKAVKAHCVDLLSKGIPVPGWKLVEGRATRCWQDEKTAETALTGILAQDAYETKLLSPAKAEAALKTAGWKKPEIQNYVAPLVATRRGLAVVPESDSRPGVDPSQTPASVFDAVE